MDGQLNSETSSVIEKIVDDSQALVTTDVQREYFFRWNNYGRFVAAGLKGHYQGTVTLGEKAKRRAANKVAAKSQRANRGK